MELVFPVLKKTILGFSFLALLTGMSLFILSNPCFASFESSLIGIKTKLTGVVLPLLSVIGLGFSAISFVTGNPNAKIHITYSLIGAAVGFGAQAIVDFISQTIH